VKNFNFKNFILNFLAFCLDSSPALLVFVAYSVYQTFKLATPFAEISPLPWWVLGLLLVWHLFNELYLSIKKGGTIGQKLWKVSGYKWWRVFVLPLMISLLLLRFETRASFDGLSINFFNQVTLSTLGAKGPATKEWDANSRQQFEQYCLNFLFASTSSLLSGMELNLTQELRAKLEPEMKKNCTCQLEQMEKSGLGDTFLEQGLGSESAFQEIYMHQDNAFEILSITQRCQQADSFNE